MKKSNNNPNTNGKSAEDRALDTFAELMIDKIKSLQEDWKKPWFSPNAVQLPKNLSGRAYNGMNSIILMLMQEKMGWETARYATFERIVNLNYTLGKNGKEQAVDIYGNKMPHVGINKGEKSTPVLLTTFTCVNKETKERIKYDDYKKLSAKEQEKYNVYPKQQVYHVFNLSQTNIKESRPDMYEKFKEEKEGKFEGTTEGMKEFPALDAMIEKDLYVCPIKPVKGDAAYYSMAKDEIVVPQKAQFIDGESFYTNLLHEMSHASGSENRLNRLKPGQSFGSAEYAKEELVAELTAALVSTQYGMAKHVKSDSAAYLKSWLHSLNEDPNFIKSSLMDVKRSASFISQRIDAVDKRLERDGWEADFSDVRQQNKSFTPMFSGKGDKTSVPQQGSEPVQEKPSESQQREEVAARGTEQPRFHR